MSVCLITWRKIGEGIGVKCRGIWGYETIEDTANTCYANTKHDRFDNPVHESVKGYVTGLGSKHFPAVPHYPVPCTLPLPNHRESFLLGGDQSLGVYLFVWCDMPLDYLYTWPLW